MNNIDIVVGAWASYLKTISSWQDLVKDIAPKQTGCGPVYELPNPIDRPNEDFAIADMRNLKIAEPHYHSNGDIEVYIVLEGSGTVVVGHKEQRVEKGSVIITPTVTAHYAVPEKDLVLACVNTPPFNPEHYVAVTETDLKVGFNKEQFEKWREK